MNVEKWYSQGKKTNINKLEVFYRRSGSNQEQAETLICLHGFPTSSWDFEAIWPDLESRFDVLAHDFIGLGRSAKPQQKLTIKLQADIAEELVLSLDVKKAHILAHDLGDTVAQELLARQAEGNAKVEWLSCVFLNGGLFPETHRALITQKLLASPFGPLLAKAMSKKAFHKTMRNIFSTENPPSEGFINGSWQLLNENNGRSMLPRLIHYMEERRNNRDRWVGPMENSTIPLRLINGVQDPISGIHAANRYKEVVSNADIALVEKAGHYPQVEAPKEVLAAFLAFHDQLAE